MIVGSKSKLAFELGTKIKSAWLNVNIWVDSTLIIYPEKPLYIPVILKSSRQELSDIENGKMNGDFIFTNHGCDADINVRAKINMNDIEFNCKFEKGKNLVVVLPVCMVVETYKKYISVLSGNVT